MKNRSRHAQVLEGPLPSRDCLDCSETIADTETAFYWETSDDEQFWLSSPKTEGPVCEACWVKRDNYEPPDADGEDICRDYRAEERDSMIAAQRLK